MDRIQILDKFFVPYITEQMLQDRIKALAEQINNDYSGKNPLFLCVLNGSFLFAADLYRNITLPSEIQFVKLKSYEGMASTGQITTAMGINFEMEDKDIIILEDIVDTGKTLHHFIPELIKHKPSSINIATLLRKPDALKFPLECDYVGFDIDNKFVVGYGLDYNEKGRNLPMIYQLEIK